MRAVEFATRPWRIISMCCLLLVFMSTACSEDNEPAPTPTQNKARLITDKSKLAMIYSLTDLENNKGRIYEMTYNVDYKLNEALNYNIDGAAKLTEFVKENLLDISPDRSTNLAYGAGCSAFACTDANNGQFLMGRNFDFNHIDSVSKKRIMIPLIVVHTAPPGEKKSISFVDGLFVNYTSGFYTDGNSDLSMLMALPYLLLDGINEDGFAVSVLKLDGMPTLQKTEGKNKIFTTVAMRMLLDRASTVDEAVDMLKEYNMCMDKDAANYHFFMADAKGDYAIVEYVNSDIKANPDKMNVLKGDDCLRYVTNFYVSPVMADTPYGINNSKHGRVRYDILANCLQQHNYKLTMEEGMSLLEDVYQGPESTLSTGFTQWSEMFNLTNKTVTMCILGEYQEKRFEFSIQ